MFFQNESNEYNRKISVFNDIDVFSQNDIIFSVLLDTEKGRVKWNQI